VRVDRRRALSDRPGRDIDDLEPEAQVFGSVEVLEGITSAVSTWLTRSARPLAGVWQTARHGRRGTVRR